MPRTHGSANLTAAEFLVNRRTGDRACLELPDLDLTGSRHQLDAGPAHRARDGADGPAGLNKGSATGSISASAAMLLTISAAVTPTLAASAPIQSAPSGCVPMQTESMPIAPLRCSSGMASSTIVL